MSWRQAPEQVSIIDVSTPASAHFGTLPYDSALLAEIALLGELIAAAGQTGQSALAMTDVDEILADEDAPMPR